YFEAYLFLLYFFLIYSIFDWYNDVWIITNRGIIDVNWKYFMSEVVYTSYDDISGIEVKEDSFWDSMMKRGNIIIYLEGEGAEFILEGAYDPQEVVNYIKEVTAMIQSNKIDVSKDVPDLLIDTMKQVVEDYLLKKHEEDNGQIYRDKEYEETLRKAKARKSTIDLTGE
ncbi:MAG: hypothetical protein PHO80_05395, partial [Candidatus Gracilibacteria bacterium]|nr:hypothetical protein [Candidatus Gracilibacteria bacterium]